MNLVKEKLRRGEPVIGTWITIGHPDVPEVLSRLGFDWLVFDMEHSPLTVNVVESLMQAMNGTETLPMVRVGWNDPVLIKFALDIGAMGVVIPWVNSRSEAEKAVKACKYPPEGFRGCGPRRASMYGLKMNEYLKNANEDILILVQIETVEALNNIDEILSTPGVDGFFIGPNDLSFSLGIPRQFTHPKYIEALKKTLEAAERNKVAPGIHGLSTEDAVEKIKMGFRFVAIASDISFLIDGFKNCISKIKSEVGL